MKYYKLIFTCFLLIFALIISSYAIMAEVEPLLKLVSQIQFPMIDVPVGEAFSLKARALDVWADNDLAAVSADSRVYLVNLNDMNNPIYNTLELQSGDHSWDVKLHNGLLYIGLQRSSDGATMLIYNVDDFTAPRLITRYTTNKFAGAHNIFIAGQVGFIASYESVGGGGLSPHMIENRLWMVDLSDPTQPRDIGPLIEPEDMPEQMVNVHDITMIENRLYVAGWNTGFWIVEFQNLDSPSELQFTVVGHEQYKPFLKPRGTLPSTHNVWPSEDETLVWTTDEVIGEGVRVFKVSNQGRIQLAGFFRLGSDTLPHNVVVNGDFAYVSYYLEGLRVLQFEELEGPKEVARFETAFNKHSDNPFSGAFGVFPYGNFVLLSDMLGGLYILEKQGILKET